MVLKRNGIPVSGYTSEYQGRKIVIGIDSSKSNSAIVIGDPNGEVYNDYEIDGSGSENNVYIVASETRRVMRDLLFKADIVAVGIEDIITKKEGKNFNPGLDMHKSRAAITHIFDSFIILFMDYFNVMPALVPNQTWKATILPEEYNTRAHKKGSKDYYDECFPGSRWANRKDDVTDAYCIYQFILIKKKLHMDYTIERASLFKGEFSWGLFDESIVPTLGNRAKKFNFNETLTLEQTANSLASSMSIKDEYFYCYIPMRFIDAKVIYSEHLMGTFPKGVENVVMVVAK